MTMFASHAPGEVIDAIRPDLEAFTSLWTALRVNYEGTNITRTVARLLHMYQPEEGVIAYERLLRTLFVLLEDFDSDGLQLLVSMVPPPKGVADDLVKEVFNRATGFVRVDAPIFHKNTDATAAAANPDFPHPKTEPQPSSSATIRSSEIQKLPAPETKKNSTQTTSQESTEVFRGFPPSEIFNTQSHVQSIKNLYRPSASYACPQSSGGQSFINFGQIVGQNSGQIQQPIGSGLVGPAGYRAKWFQSPYLIQKNSYPVAQYQDYYLKTVNNRFVKVPAAKVNNFHQSSMNTSQASYQTLYNNQHDYMRNRSNTVTSGLLEKIQRHRSIQEAAIKKILTECESSEKNSVPRVPDNDVSSSQGNVEVEVEIGEEENKTSEHPAVNKTNIGIISKTVSCDETTTRNGVFGTVGNEGDKTAGEVDSSGINHPLNSETFEEFAKEVRMRQRAIQEDIYKMDIVRSEDFAGAKEEADSFIEPQILTPSEELRNSCSKFMDRAKTEEIIEVPVFPKTRALNEAHEQPAAVPPQSESNLWRLLTTKNVSISSNAEQTDDVVHEELEEPVAQQETDIISPVEVIATVSEPTLGPSGSVQRRVIRKKKPEGQSTRPKGQRAVQKGTVINHTPNLQGDSNLVDPEVGAELADLRIMNSNPQPEPTTRCSMSAAPRTTSSCSIGPATTMAELAAYKKQYYDALLSIQKAKAAVANSLAISSAGSSPGFDPYYYSYLQQQHRQLLQRRQHQIFMGQRFSQQQSMAAAAGTPWFRTANWRYPVISQSRLPQRPEMVRPSSSSMWPPGVGYLGRDSQNMTTPQRQQLNIVHQVPKPAIKRRKLEEIVGKLKETESNGTVND